MPSGPLPSVRQLLIAWNTHPEMSREAICRLGQLAPELARREPGKTAALDEARAMGLPRLQLARALEACAGAAAAAAGEEARAGRLGARLVTLEDDAYPAPLRQLGLPPPVLAVRGRLPGEPAVAVVGSRHPDPYGREVGALFGRALAAAGVAVVSGFAHGVDAAAHRGALAAGGPTVGVLGCGLGVDYPSGQARLGEEIAACGALISEFPCDVPPRKWHFPVRNRVIAALSQAVLVVEATLRSGSLSTAHHALELGREVYAVPGRIFDELAAGTNALIHDGAAVARHPDDILEPLGRAGGGGFPGDLGAPRASLASPTFPASLSSTSSTSPTSSTSVDDTRDAGSPSSPSPADGRRRPAGFAGNVLAAAERVSRISSDQIAGQLGAPLDRVLAALLGLEIEAWIERLPGGLYRSRRVP